MSTSLEPALVFASIDLFINNDVTGHKDNHILLSTFIVNISKSSHSFTKLTHMNTIGYFEIQSTEPQREIRFYETLFNWKFSRDETVPIEYYHIETNSIDGALLKRPAEVPPTHSGTNAFVCSIQVESFDHSAKLILENGGRVAMPKFAIPGRCWQGYFIDPDNNTFGIFEVDENAK